MCRRERRRCLCAKRRPGPAQRTACQQSQVMVLAPSDIAQPVQPRRAGGLWSLDVAAKGAVSGALAMQLLCKEWCLVSAHDIHLLETKPGPAAIFACIRRRSDLSAILHPGSGTTGQQQPCDVPGRSLGRGCQAARHVHNGCSAMTHAGSAQWHDFTACLRHTFRRSSKPLPSDCAVSMGSQAVSCYSQKQPRQLAGTAL